MLLLSCLYVCVFSCHAKVADSAVQYRKYTINSDNSETLIQVLTLDPKRVKIVAVRAHETGDSIATVGIIAKHFNALAAINGGFFRLNETDNNWVAAGALKIDNQWHGIAYQSRGAIGWSPVTNTLLFDRLQTDSKIIVGNNTLPINVMNKIVTGNKTALLSDSFTDSVKFNNSTGITILDHRVQAVYNNHDTMTIPPDAYLYYLSGTTPNNIKAFKVGEPAIIDIKVRPQLNKQSANQWNKLPYIVGGGPLLIHKGKKITNFNVENLDKKFLYNRDARTAVGILPDGRWVFVVVTGSLLPNTAGFTILELRDFMSSLGCTAALNLDGGGSSAMYLRDATDLVVVERPVADAILVLAKN